MITGACCGSFISAAAARRPERVSRGVHQRSAATSSSGVSSIDSVTAAISSDDTGVEITPACAAVWNTTKPNSPPCASSMTKTGRSRSGIGIAIAIAHSTSSLSARKPSTTAAISHGCCRTTAKSMLMPTAMKKRPSSSPLNGSMSVSSSRRYSLSASSTPARKAPSAIDRPTASMSAAVATTTSNDAAVKISGVLLPAIQRSIGLSSSRPPNTITATVPIARAAPSQPPLPAPPVETARNGSSARIGDRGDVLQQGHAEDALARGRRHQVAFFQHAEPDRRRRERESERGDHREAPVGAERHGGGRQQRGRAQQLGAAPAEDRLAHRPEPLRLELQPDQKQHQHDAELGEAQDLFGVGHQLQAPGPDQDAGAQVADDRAEPERSCHRHGDDRGAQIDQHADEP